GVTGSTPVHRSAKPFQASRPASPRSTGRGPRATGTAPAGGSTGSPGPDARADCGCHRRSAGAERPPPQHVGPATPKPIHSRLLRWIQPKRASCRSFRPPGSPVGKSAAREGDVLVYVLPSVPRAVSRIGGRRVRPMDGVRSRKGPRYRLTLRWPKYGDLLLLQR